MGTMNCDDFSNLNISIDILTNNEMKVYGGGTKDGNNIFVGNITIPALDEPQNIILSCPTIDLDTFYCRLILMHFGSTVYVDNLCIYIP